MKKIFSFTVCLFIAGAVFAQRNYYYYPPHESQQQTKARRPYDPFFSTTVGIKAGANVANTVDAYDFSQHTNSITGFHAGLEFTFPLFFPISFVPEVLFSQQGYQTYTTEGTYIRRNNYIDIPLLIKWRIIRRFNILTGAQFNIPLTDNTEYSNGTNNNDSNAPSQTNYFNNGQSYIAGIAGISIDVNQYMDIYSRYVIDLVPNTGDPHSPIAQYRNQVWQFGLGIKFR